MCKINGQCILLIIVFIFPVLLYFFMSGFLLNETIIHDPLVNEDEAPSASVNKVVLVIIDALRTDFVFDSEIEKWPVFDALRKENKLYCEYSRIQAPSVTLPRIKAITSGRVPQFMDVISNFGDNAMQSDTWLSILSKKGWKLRFFGDETWLRLFPKLFTESDPVSSLFVNDFHEVDLNVTRHIKEVFPILSSKEIIILHYLGLDHIGHVEGPRGLSIPAKLKEMNFAISQIVNSFGPSKDWLLIVTSDHGMANEGGHGGASHEEILTPLLYASPLFTLGNETSCRPDLRQTGSQLDISSVIAMATGLNPLLGSLGLVSPSLVASFLNQNPEKIADFYRVELRRFMQRMDCDEQGKCENEIEMPEATITKLLLAREHLKQDLHRHCHDGPAFNSCESDRMEDLLKHSKETFEVLRIAQDHLIQHSSEVSLPQMLIFSSLMWLVNGYIWLRFIKYVFLKMEQTLPTIKEQQWSSSPWVKGLLKFSLLVILGHAVTLLSSSFVEEEHQFWYSCSTTLTLLTLMPLLVWHYRHKFISKRLFLGDLFYGTLLMVSDRFLRLLHNTGDKWRHLEDLSDWFYQTSQGDHWLKISLLLAILLIVFLRWKELIKSRIRGSRCCSCKSCFVNFLPGLSILGVAFVLLLYRGQQFAGHPQNSSQVIMTAQLAYLMIAVDFIFSLLHWTKQRRSCTQWRVLNESREGSPDGTLSCLTIRTSAQPVSHSLALLVCLLGRPAMTILWAGVLLKERLLLTHWARISARLPQLDQTSLKITMAAHFWITGWVTFYQQGNSHSIATLDFSAGLVGMTEFNYYICGALVAVFTFAGPLFWHIQFHTRANSIFPRRQNERDRLMLAHFAYGMLSWPVSIYSFVCIVLRHHLFVWSVFAPKLVYLAFVTAFMTPIYAISFLVQLF